MYDLDIEKLEREQMDIKERIEKLEKEIQEDQFGNMAALKKIEISRNKINFFKNSQELRKLKYRKRMQEAQEKLYKKEISQTEYNNIIRNRKKDIEAIDELLGAFEPINSSYRIQNPEEMIQNVIIPSESVLRLDSLSTLIATACRNTNKSFFDKTIGKDPSDLQLIEILKEVQNCVDIFKEIIHSFETAEGKKIDRSYRTVQGIMHRRGMGKSEEMRELEKTLDRTSYLASFQSLKLYHQWNKDMDFGSSLDIFQKFTLSTEPPLKFDTYPSKRHFDNMRERSLHDKFDREKFDEKNGTVLRNIDLIKELEQIIIVIQNKLPEKCYVNGQEIDFTKFHKALGELLKNLEKMKEKNEAKLKGFNELEQKYAREEETKRHISTLTDMYKKLNSLVGNERKEMETAIEEYKKNMIENGYTESEIIEIEGKAKDVIGAEKSLDSLKKFTSITSKIQEERRIGYMEKGLDPATFDQIRIEAETAAKREFPNGIVYRNGEYTIDPRVEQFINEYIIRKSNEILGKRFDKQQELQEEEMQKKQSLEKEEADKKKKTAAQQRIDTTIHQQNLTEQQIALAASILRRNSMIRSAELSELSIEEMEMAVQYAVKLKGLAYKSEDEIALEMAKDPYKDEGYDSRVIQNDHPTEYDVLVQKGINQRNRVVADINELFGDKMILQ